MRALAPYVRTVLDAWDKRDDATARADREIRDNRQKALDGLKKQLPEYKGEF